MRAAGIFFRAGLRRQALAAVLVAAIWAAGCEEHKEDEGPTHPSLRRAEAFLEAVKYRDLNGAFDQHLESTKQGVYCQSESFARVLERTRQRKKPADCRDARSLPASERAALADDAELLVQILRFVCEHPEGGCVQYAREVFETHLPRTTFWKRFGDYRIRRVRGDGGRATVYLDITPRGESSGEPIHRALKMQKVGQQWWVAEQFGP